jgi:hypothetical protein
MIKDIETSKVDSSAISEVGYDPESKTLRIVFPSGAIWDYVNVSQQRYDAFIGAPSIGSYFAKQIRGEFLGNRVD